MHEQWMHRPLRELMADISCFHEKTRYLRAGKKRHGDVAEAVKQVALAKNRSQEERTATQAKRFAAAAPTKIAGRGERW